MDARNRHLSLKPVAKVATRVMTSYLCCASCGSRAHEGSLDMSVGLQSRSRGSPYVRRLMGGSGAAGIAMDDCEAETHSFNVGSCGQQEQ